MYCKTVLNGQIIEYELQRKPVKNINLRIKHDGTVHVSANNRVSQNIIDNFILSKGDFILKALDKVNNTAKHPSKQYFSDEEICGVITKLCHKVYPHFEKRGVPFPKIKFRKMVSRWGSCHTVKGVLTFNTNLKYAPIECIEYVVAHEFAHFLQANHSPDFYNELTKYMPDWKLRRKALKAISIR